MSHISAPMILSLEVHRNFLTGQITCKFLVATDVDLLTFYLPASLVDKQCNQPNDVVHYQQVTSNVPILFVMVCLRIVQLSIYTMGKPHRVANGGLYPPVITLVTLKTYPM